MDIRRAQDAGGTAAVTSATLPVEQTELGRETLRRVTWRLMPFLVAGYLCSIIDRSNIGFASLQMNHQLGLTQTMFGLAGGIYFIAFSLFEVPSNLALERFGASRWIARVLISWGLVAGATAFVVGAKSLLAMRFLLGVTEAGFFPGVILYITYWFPASYRARMVGIFMVSIPAANALGSPIAGYLLTMDNALGLRGWQWLFIMEAVPTVLLGFVAYWWLTDRPHNARWLSPAQRTWLAGEIERDAAQRAVNRAPRISVWKTLVDRRVLFLALISASTTTVSTALAIWQPIIVRAFALSYVETGFVNALPYVAACIAMVLWGRHSDRTGERTWHNALPMIVVVLGFAGLLVFTSLWLSVTLLTLVMVGTYACKGPFWAMSSEWLPRSAAAAGLAQISAVSNLAGFFASYLIGAIKDATGSYPLSLMPLMALCAVGTIALIAVSFRKRTEHA
jgi:MFS family permease